jgi:hypothetical protein
MDDDPSIEQVYQQLLGTANLQIGAFTEVEKLRIQRAIFAVLCWTSAMLTPLLDDEECDISRSTTTDTADEYQPVRSRTVSFSLVAEGSSQRYSSKDFRRPISKMFYVYDPYGNDVDVESHPECESFCNLRNDGDELLRASCLNYYSLFTIGRVKIRWVNTLTEHLTFDRPNRTLSVFRFPSYCVASVLRKRFVKPLNR